MLCRGPSLCSAHTHSSPRYKAKYDVYGLPALPLLSHPPSFFSLLSAAVRLLLHDLLIRPSTTRSQINVTLARRQCLPSTASSSSPSSPSPSPSSPPPSPMRPAPISALWLGLTSPSTSSGPSTSSTTTARSSQRAPTTRSRTSRPASTMNPRTRKSRDAITTRRSSRPAITMTRSPRTSRRAVTTTRISRPATTTRGLPMRTSTLTRTASGRAAVAVTRLASSLPVTTTLDPRTRTSTPTPRAFGRAVVAATKLVNFPTRTPPSSSVACSGTRATPPPRGSTRSPTTFA